MTEMIGSAIKLLIAGGVFAFIEFVIKRHDDKKDKKEGLQAALASIKTEIASLKEDIDKRLKKAEKDNLRTQLLVMIYFRPDQEQEILTVAERYFVKLRANWYLTGIFKAWCNEHGLEPEWFDFKE